MRILKGLILFSASVLMLALAAHLAGVDIDLPPTPEAQAQGSAIYPGPPIAYLTAAPGFPTMVTIIDEDGYVWSCANAHTPESVVPWERGAQILAPGTPIPTADSSVGGLKGSFRGN